MGLALASALAALALARASRRPRDGSVHKRETYPALVNFQQWRDAALLGWHWRGSSGEWWRWGWRVATHGSGGCAAELLGWQRCNTCTAMLLGQEGAASVLWCC